MMAGNSIQDRTINLDILLLNPESGVFGPAEFHSPFYVLDMVLHDQSHDITVGLDRVHEALVERGLPANHAIHKGPLIRCELAYRKTEIPECCSATVPRRV